MENKKPRELKKYIFFQLNECEAIREYLEEMALKGWKLKDYNTFLYFEAIEPQKLYYSVEVFAKASVFDTIPTDAANEYIEFCRQAGWEFVCTARQINIFVSDALNPIPIETDEAFKLKTIIKGILKQNWGIWFLIFPMMLYNSKIWFTYFASNVTTYAALFSFFIYMIILALVLSQAGGFIVWIIRQKIRLNSGEPLKHISQKNMQLRSIIRWILLTIVVIFILFSFAQVQFLQRDYAASSIYLLYILLIALTFLVSYFLYKGGFSRVANHVLTAALGIGIASAFIGIVSLLVFASPSPGDWQEEEPEPPVGLLYSNGTFLAEEATYKYSSEVCERQCFTVFSSNYAFIINRYLHSEMSFISAYDDSEFVEISLPQWEAKSVYVSSAEGRAAERQIFEGMTFVVYDDYVVSFSPCLCCPEVSLTKDIVDQIMGRNGK